MHDFAVRKFYAYKGPSFYLDRRALVFNLSIGDRVPDVGHYRDAVLEKFPILEADFPDSLPELFARALIQVLKMDIDLFINRYSLGRDGREHVIAVEYLDEVIAEESALFVADWFFALTGDKRFDFDAGFGKLQAQFDKTLFGGPTIYSLIEAGLKRGIPVMYLRNEDQFLWGYGSRQIRGRSTTLHTDSIKDTEFTTLKDRCKEFLLDCGFPTPLGANCFDEEEAVEEAETQGYPVVVKPVAGHKGQGVTTGIESEQAVRKSFRRIVAAAKAEGVPFDGAIVERQIYGTDHRLLAVDGKFVAALQRVPAYVDGNGRDPIEDLIAAENDTVVRLDNARSPLCKIQIDEDLVEYLELQDLSLKSVPGDGQRIYLRRVANISAGGVSINVTDKIHPDNVRMVEDIAKYFQLTCLGIDALAEDIAKPWSDGNFGIIEINSGPGVFMHLAPAIGGSIDVPGQVIRAHFPKPGSERIPVIAGNRLSPALARGLAERWNSSHPGSEFGSLTAEGVHFDGHFFHNHKHHSVNVLNMLRNPKLGFALFNHTSDDIHDYGTVHEGADLVVLERPSDAEAILERDLLPGGYLVTVEPERITVEKDGREIESRELGADDDRDTVLLELLGDRLAELAARYS